MRRAAPPVRHPIRAADLTRAWSVRSLSLCFGWRVKSVHAQVQRRAATVAVSGDAFRAGGDATGDVAARLRALRGRLALLLRVRGELSLEQRFAEVNITRAGTHSTPCCAYSAVRQC
jgi:hypothetical protein